MAQRSILLVAIMLIMACGGAADSGGEAAITIDNFSFGDPITVGAGQPVVVTNDDGVAHTWTSPDGVFDSGSIPSGDSFEFTFAQAGEYEFFCSIHPSMAGTITVTG